jgi:uncharacterized membrane protein YgcG
MKTLTEFVSFTLKNVIQAQKELTDAGKTAEEIPAALTEKFKVEGDKLKYLTTAAEMVKNRLDGLKRVIVLQLAEGENAPSGAEKHEELYFVVEHFAAKQSQAPAREERGGRGDKRGGKGGRGGRGGDRDGKGKGGGRGPGGDRGERSAAPRPAGGGGIPKPKAAGGGEKAEKPSS